MQDYTIENKRVFDSRKKEKIDGKIYLMASPTKEHREVQANLVNIFNNHFKSNKKRCISIFDHDLKINKNNILEPDLKVYCYGTSQEIPLIIVEVLSDSTRQNDLGIKMKKYAEFGIKEYWIITWELSLIDIYLLTEDKKYEYYTSYSLSAKAEEDTFEDEQKKPAKEFTPISFPELKIQLEDVFYFVK